MKPKRTLTKKSNGVKIEQAVVQEDSSQKKDTRASEKLPSVTTLALIAATITKGNTIEPGMAVHHAFQLWVFARQKLEEELVENAEIQFVEKAIAEELKDIVLPKSFPANFDKLLRLNVGAKTITDATGRFRKFLRSKHTAGDVDRKMTDLRQQGIPDPEEWLRLFADYREWWAGHKSQQARASAGHRRKLKMPH